MHFEELDDRIPSGCEPIGDTPVYVWPQGTGRAVSDWGTDPPDWDWNAELDDVQWLEIDDSQGAGVRVTDHGTKSPGDYLVFCELPAPDTSRASYWYGMTYERLCRDLHGKVTATEGATKYMRLAFARILVEIATGDAAATEATVPTPRSVQTELPGLSPRQLLVTMLLFNVCESRNYPDYWRNGGGRYLPTRLALAVIWDQLPPKEFRKLGRSAGSRVLQTINDAVPPPFQMLAPQLDRPPEGEPRGDWFTYEY